MVGALADGAREVVDVDPDRSPGLPPRWFVRTIWTLHRALYRFTGGRLGLWRPKPGGWGTMLLKTTGRRTGQQRAVIVGYYEDGPNLVTIAMNGWAEPEPAWWLNLQAHPDAIVELKDGQRAVRARAAEGEERARLWGGWQSIDDGVDGLAARRPTETAIVVLEPRPRTSAASSAGG
jgi:F420H(2)-dependent quinone reductase